MVGWGIVVVYAAALVVATVSTPDHDVARNDVERDDDAVEAFVGAWERSLRATFVRSGTFERRSEVTGAAITSEDVLAQRPPRRLHRQLGGVNGRDDRRLILCPAGPEGEEAPPCSTGDAAGPTYEEDVVTTVENLRGYVEGPNPVYAVERVGDGCFELTQLRVEPRVPFGVEARFCFDQATGAPTDTRVTYAGGVVEVLAVADLTDTVRDEDLEP